VRPGTFRTRQLEHAQANGRDRDEQVHVDDGRDDVGHDDSAPDEARIVAQIRRAVAAREWTSPCAARSRDRPCSHGRAAVANSHESIIRTETRMDKSTEDRLAIREVIENWALWRDAGDWERFRTVWHDDGRMMATWFQGPASEFIRVSTEGWNRGVSILHFLGGSTIDLAGGRAIAQTKMTISQRADVHGVRVDVVCTGRFYDFMERRGERWGVVLRQPIYEKDRMDPVDPAARLTLDPELLVQFPEGYRHLAYLQTGIGYQVKPDMPGLKGPEVEALYARGKRWLAGAPL
jgi:hypothetical protein